MLIDHDYAENNGKLIKSTYGNGFYTENIYDSLDRVTGIKYNGVKRFGWDFNYKGQIGLHTDLINNQTFSYTYDAAGRLTNVLGRSSGNMPSINFSNVYDSDGRLTSVNRKVGSTSILTQYTYSDTGRLTKETFNSGSAQIYNYDGYGRVGSKVLSTSVGANIFTNSYTFRGTDDSYETTAMISSETLNGSNWSTTYGYTYYDDGNIYQITKNGELYATYYYDDLGQLTHAVIDDWVYLYHYDVGGNLTYKSQAPIRGGTGGSEIDYYYENDQWADLLTMYNDNWVDYDEIGNPVYIYGENDDRYFEWEGRKLTYLYDGIDGVEVYYTYNADGIRTQKDVNGTVTYYTLDGSKIISQKTDDSEIFFEYDATGQVKCMTYNGATYYYVYNMLGDIIGLSNVAGNLVVTYEYHPYGEIKEYTDTSGINLANINPFRYKGYYFDTETGYYYLNSRYYDPELCRFVNADGFVSTGQGLAGLNMFAYCGNNPVDRIDPTGMFWKEIRNFFSNAWNGIKTWAKNTFGAEFSTTATITEIETPIIPDPAPITAKTGIKTTQTISKHGDSSKPISVYANKDAEHPIKSSSAGIKLNIGGFTLDFSVGLDNMGVSGSLTNGNTIKKFSMKTNLSELKVGYEGSTAIQWDNTTETAYANVGVSGWAIAAAYILVTTGQYVQSPSYGYSY